MTVTGIRSSSARCGIVWAGYPAPGPAKRKALTARPRHAGYRQDLAGRRQLDSADIHVGRSGHSVEDGVGDILRIEKTAAFEEGGLGGSVVEKGVVDEFGAGAARADLRGAHAGAEELNAEILVEQMKPALGRGVECLAYRIEPADRTDGHDVAASAGNHARQDEAAGMERDRKVRGDGAVDHGGIDLRHAIAEAEPVATLLTRMPIASPSSSRVSASVSVASKACA